MNEYLLDFLKRSNLELTNQKVTLAVSTGVDSMALLVSFLNLQKIIPFEIIVCHVNHNKRSQSIEEEKYIKEFCQKENIKCYVKSLEFNNTSNFQAVARSKRYEFFYEVMDKENSNILALAHHGDDLMETVIMRILRGSSLNGYSGIKEVGEFNHKLIIHPFLHLSKDDLLKYQKSKNFKYYEDISNSHLDYTRNKIRHLVIPALKEIDDNCLNKFNEFSSKIIDASREINSLRDEFIRNKVNKRNGEISFLISDFNSLSDYLKTEVLFELLKEEKFSSKNIEEVMKYINSNQSNLKLKYKSIYFLKEYDKITFSKRSNDVLDVEILIDRIGVYQINDTISISVTEKERNIIPNINELCYNIQKLPIKIRTRRYGDKILLPNGYKKIKDLLIDEKVSLSKREKILLAVDKDDKVLIVFGVRKSTVLESIEESNIIIRMEAK